MRVLVIGGSGHVGTLVLPALAQQHTLRVFDLKPPALASLDYVQGDITDFDALAQATRDQEALLYMAMGAQRGSHLHLVNTNFDVNVKGVYFALLAAHQAGIPHAVYTSSMSVYDGRLETRYFFDEDMPTDCRHHYGLTKRLGEDICRNACHEWGMTINALRLCLPIADEQWRTETRLGIPTIATAASDVSRALLAALDFRGYGFQAFMISGDYEQKIMNMTRARKLLQWEPLARPTHAQL
jgi:nucleoside-diphosphate-sugar epimerase